MFTDSNSNTPNWLQQKDHGSSNVTRPVIVAQRKSTGDFF